MTEVWRKLKVGDRIRLTEMPPEFLREGCYLHPDTKRVYKKLVARKRPLRIYKVRDGGPWIHCRFRRKNGRLEYHWLLFNHGGIVRVSRRATT